VKIRNDVLLGQHSHVGMTRTANEDFFGYWEPDEDRQFDLKGRLVVVCDGMGGHNGGEIASNLAVKTIIKEYEADDSGNVMEALRHAIERANRAVFDEAHRPDHKDRLKGMGTTVTAVAQRREMVYFAQVGDSRAYLIRGDAIKQMTKDHSLVQQLVDEGLLEASEMESHPDKNVILRSLGVKPEVEVDISYAPLAPGDVYLVCSDGLSGLVSPDEMLKIVRAGLATHGDPRKVCEQLVDLANKYGGHDNITVQILKVVSTDTSTTDSTPGQTVTQSFTPDQVAASIAQAKAAAGGAPGKKRDSGGAEATAKVPATGKLPAVAKAPVTEKAPAVVPATQPAMPVPVMEPPPGREPSLAAVVGAALGLGVILGLALGFALGRATAPAPAAPGSSQGGGGR
jgi:serine/threonine protein phosphatase PrpC